MKPFPHDYSVKLTGGPGAYAELTAGSMPVLRTAPPPQFGGPGDAWSPAELLLAATASCFLFTLRAIAGLPKMEFVRFDLKADGVVDRRERPTLRKFPPGSFTSTADSRCSRGFDRSAPGTTVAHL